MMPVPVMVGSILMTTAFILYTVGIFTMIKRHKVKRMNVIILACASACDLSGTLCMIGFKSWNFLPADIHGWIGYLALLLMIVNLVLVFYNLSMKSLPKKLIIYDICVYVLWVCSYLFGFTKMF